MATVQGSGRGKRLLLASGLGLLVCAGALYAGRFTLLHHYLRATDPDYLVRDGSLGGLNTPQEMLGFSYHRSACTNRPDRLRLLHRFGLRSPDGNPHTPMACAVTAGHLDAVRELVRLTGQVDVGSPPRPGDKWSPVSPLQLAAHAGDMKMTELLLSLGADPNLGWSGEHGTSNESPTRMAARQRHFDVLGILIKAGGQTELLDVPLLFDAVEGEIAAGKSAQTDWNNFLTRAETAGLAPGAKSMDERSLMHLAAANGELALVDVLLKRGAKADQVDKKGVLPFMYLAFWYARTSKAETLGPEFEATLASLLRDAPDLNQAATAPDGIALKNIWYFHEGWTVAHAAAQKPRLHAALGDKVDYGRIDERAWPKMDEAQANAFIASLSPKQFREAKTLGAGLRWSQLTEMASAVEKRQVALR